jgi:2-polyprenyl-3-methyl-5-hydroxy-6-metoxy-1,4-benzoquinol methylase
MSDSIYTGGEYASSHPTYHVEDSAWKANQILKMLQRRLLAPKFVCEVGCGAGEILRQLQQHLPTVELFDGYDISPQAIELSRTRANSRLQFFCKDFLAADTRHYDLLLCMDVFEHVEDYLGFLRKLRARAQYKMFHIPLDLSAQAVLRGSPIAEAKAAHGHIHYFTKDTALAALSYADYEIVDWMYTGAGVEKSYGWLNLLARYPRVLLSRICPDALVRAMGGYSVLALTK